MKTMQRELADLQNEKVNSSWQHMQDLSVQGDVGNNINLCNVPISCSSPNCWDVKGPVTVTHLRASDEIQGRTAAEQARFQKQTEEYLTQGEFFSKTVKSGCERVGGSEHKLVYIRWPQEAVFIGPDRKRVRYDELSQGQWMAGLTAFAAEEPNVSVQKNILAYLASLLQDVCDRLNWLDLSAVQKVWESYSYRAHAAGSSDSVAVHTTAGVRHDSSATGKADRGTVSRRPCKNYNSGNCRHETSHLNNGILYEHFCTFCATKGSIKHPSVVRI